MDSYLPKSYPSLMEGKKILYVHGFLSACLLYTSINNNKTYEFITSMQEIKLQDCEQRRRWEWEDTQAAVSYTHLG